MVTVFRHLENLGDRQAASMVVTRLDWKYALRLALTDTGFNYSVLSEFRTRLVTHAAESRVFEELLRKLKARGHEQTTEAFKQVYRRRSGIEVRLSVMVRTQGLRRSR